MRQQAKADVAAVRSEVSQLKKAEAAQPGFPHVPQVADSPQGTRQQASPAALQLDSLIVSSFPPLFDKFHGKRFDVCGEEAATVSARETFTGDAMDTRIHER
jgi:hypothetical protein